ncbi:type II toxin-antitoxin system RelE/ParE family toxin [Streptomyces sp. NPDC003470]|uniref:Type II toxin-antitoxin system RelE/ParE family toxin n=1 Tax=Streptomyces anandii TaxID=285454 RepID=A0ABW6HH00_9ACTN
MGGGHTGPIRDGGLSTLAEEDLSSASQVAQAVAALREAGPTLGRPLVDRLKGSGLHHLKELRPGSGGRSEIRIVFAFDPTRSALLLLGGDKAGNWDRWYRDSIPLAERLYHDYVGDED